MTPAIVTFDPLSDITAFELAAGMDIIKAYFQKTIIDKEVFDLLDPGVKRHFVITELNPPPDEPGEGS